jgi:hypothetical protein
VDEVVKVVAEEGRKTGLGNVCSEAYQMMGIVAL